MEGLGRLGASAHLVLQGCQMLKDIIHFTSLPHFVLIFFIITILFKLAARH